MHPTRAMEVRLWRRAITAGVVAGGWLLIYGVALGACSGDEGAGAGTGGGAGGTNTTSTPTHTDTNTTTNPDSGCPDHLAPLSPSGQHEVVGDGTAASCTEASLRAAVDTLGAVPDGGTITFDCGGEHTIVLGQSLLVTTPLLVDGESLITLSGGGVTRVFELDHYVDFAVQRLTITKGHTDDSDADKSGAGILHPWFGTLTAIDVNFIDNHATSQDGEIGGGAVFAGGLSQAIFSGCVFANNSASNGGGVLNRGSDLTIVDSLFSQNDATSYADSGQYGNGGGLYIDGMNYDVPGDLHLCGTIFEKNSATQHGSAVFSYFYDGSHSYIDRCAFVDNHFDQSPGGGAGTLYHQAVGLTLTASLFDSNRTGGHAAGLFVGSGSSAEVTNCTFSGNRTAGNGAAIFSGSSPVDILSCTFSGNDADYGPAIFKGQSADIKVTSSIFAGNTTANEFSALSCHEPLTDGGGNIQWPSTKNNGHDDTPCADSIVFADPLLVALADNGGPTATMALLASSPAADLASECPSADQRGQPRVAPCDAGAFEHQP